MEKTVKHNAKNATKTMNNENASIVPVVITNSLPSVRNGQARKPMLMTGEAAFSLREFDLLNRQVGKLDFDASDNIGLERNDNAVLGVAKRIDSLIMRTEAFSEASQKFHAIYDCASQTWDDYKEAINASDIDSDAIAEKSINWDKAFTTLSMLVRAFSSSWNSLKEYYEKASEYKVKRNQYIALLTEGKDLQAINEAGKEQSSIRADIGRAKASFLKTWREFLQFDIRTIA